MTTPFEQLRRAGAAYQESCIITAAGELDLFTAILERENRLTAAELAAVLGADLRGTNVLLDALSGLEYLSKDGIGEAATYSVPGPFRELLDSRSPETYVPMLRHMAAVQRKWTQLSLAVKTGKPPKPLHGFLSEEDEYRSFIWAMNSIARTLSGPTVESMREAGILDFGKKKVRFIDIGGASGTYTQAFLDAIPGSEGTLFDLTPGAEAARKRFVGSRCESRVTIIDGNFYTDEFPGGFDFAWVSAIIHQHGIEETKRLFEKAFRSLEPGGLIAVRDFIMDERRTSPKDGTLFGINMMAATETGMVYTFEEVKSALEAAGFADVKLAVPAPTMSAIVTASKKR